MKSRAAKSEWLEIMGEGNRRKGPLVVMYFGMGAESLGPRIVQLAQALDWQVLDLHFYGGLILPDLQPQGAFVDCKPTDPFVRKLQQIGCHVVRLGGLPHLRDKTIPAVIEDLVAAGRLAAEHFAERKFRHVGFVGYKPLSEFKRLYEGFRGRAAELRCACHLLEFHVLTKDEQTATRAEKFQLRNREFADWIARVPKPIGVLTSFDGLAGRLCGVAQQAGLAIPMEVALLGHGNIEMVCESAPVPLSSIHMGVGKADTAVRVMQDLLAGKRGPASAVFVAPTGVALRASTDVLASNNLVVARAIRFIWDNLQRNLSVDDVADAVAMHRRTLERLFHDQIGHGINAELSRRRLQYCQELLRTTQLPVVEIAARAGFRSKDYLHELFRRRFGVTPMKWRLRKPGDLTRPPTLLATP